MDNTWLESTFHWLSEDILKFEVDAGVSEQLAKMQWLTHAKWTFRCTVQRRHRVDHWLVGLR